MKKIYIEISDICGLKCDFCPAPKGERGVMDLATFRKAAFDARRFTRLIALHILGDPLSVGNLAEYLQIAKEANLSVEITTSGANLADFDLLLRAPIKQVNFSLDAIKRLKNAPFLMRRICDFCEYKINKKSEIFINLRVQKRVENAEIVEFLAQNLAFLPKVQNLDLVEKFTTILQNGLNSQNLGQNRVKLGNKIIIDFRDIFEWQIDSANKNLENLPLGSNNSVLGMQFRTCENFGESTDFSLVLSPKFSQIQKPHRNSQNLRAKRSNHHFDCDSLRESTANQTKFAESALDSANPALSTHEANSTIADEFLGFCEASDKDKTKVYRGSEPKRALRKQLAHTCKSLKSRCESKFATCLALKSHIGILSSGTIVPCCIDALGNLALGNIKEISLDSALKSVRAQKMLQGFRENRLVEHFCQKCDYKNRFT